ncbi:NhaA family Na+:H+ antiporter [Chitinophaga skermanii]|uniref:Na(+)/H(+) antiporter NhaA n=1 Tax=Chitinophaga skermanii TaxID=331697 RepID=A0A327Q8V0_9BACT|nr:Na+/H+ antiporter NhaA [Chitinophaga skermanii]RAJ00365.1 NhaA family Na+:H+ antiporter [Chitinophaga skermanii]
MAKKWKLFEQKILSPIYQFLHDSRAVGIVLVSCTILSLLLANSPWSQQYIQFWAHLFNPSSGHHYDVQGLHFPNSNLMWINDGLMALFFFLVGMEIKRELTTGELSSIRRSLMPVLAAIGGMVCPALIYTLFNGGTDYAHGWGIPMATDIAFSLGILSLLGNRVPVNLKIFLAALAIIDDLGAILAIAIFYTDELHTSYLLVGGGIMVVLLALNYFKVQRLVFYFIPGIILWYCIFNSGIHATIAGVLLAFTIPLSKVHKLENFLHDPVNFIIMPLFALANTAIKFPADLLHAFTNKVSYGIMLGLVIGKPLGIFFFSYIAAKLKIAALPDGAKWKQLLGVGMIAGIGFTMSIFISTLAFKELEMQIVAIMSVILASVVAALMGFIFIKRLKA